MRGEPTSHPETTLLVIVGDLYGTNAHTPYPPLPDVHVTWLPLIVSGMPPESPALSV